jgi:transposase
MANRLEMAMIQAIRQLHAAGLSHRAISRRLGVHRETVARLLRLAQLDPKPANAPSGSQGPKPANSSSAPAPEPAGAPPRAAPPAANAAELHSKPAIAPSGSDHPTCAATDTTPPPTEEPPPLVVPSRIGRLSVCEPYRQTILAMIETDLSAQRIYQDLMAQHGYQGSYYSVRRFVRRLTSKRPLPFRRMECPPGFEAQVDYGTGAPVIGPDGKRRKTHVLRIVLSHSRKAYSEASFRQTTEDFIRALENAFWQFGGVPKTIVIDNLKAAVTHPDWYDPELNPRLRSFCEHYGTVILPARPYTPRHKGKIERQIGYVKGNGLKGRIFASLAEQNDHLQHWETTVADTRIHGTTRRHVGQLFREVERPALGSLPSERFPFFHEGQRIVSRDGHIEVARAYYSVPPEYLSRTVWVRWDTKLVRVFDRNLRQIAIHVRHEPGRFSTEPVHIAAEKINGIERGTAWLLNHVRLIGAHTTAWAEAMLHERGIEGTRVLQGLRALTKKHSSASLEQACKTALSHGEFRLRALRKLLERSPETAQGALPFLEEHALIRPLADYAQIVAAALERKGFAPDVSTKTSASAQSTLRFERHDWAVECANECSSPPEESQSRRAGNNPQQQDPDPPLADQGLRDIHPPRSGYSLQGCSPAEPYAASPDSSSLRPLFPSLPGENSHDE